MADTQAPPLTVVRPGEGRAGELGSVGVVLKLWGQETGGALSVVEHPFAVGAADLVEAGPPALDQLAALAASYGVEVGDAPWLPDIIARYGLSHYGGS